MATVVTAIDNTAYVEVVNDSITDAIIQNTSSYPARLSLAASLPTVSNANFHTLAAGEIFEVVGGNPVGNVYVRAVDANRNVSIAVS